jgi:DNA-binding MarR family transcriptional regulator
MNITEEYIINFRKKLRILEKEIGIELKNETACCGVTLPQCHILIEINETGPLSLSGISDKLGLDSSTLSRTIDGLVEKGLVERNIEKNDRRSISINLSENGTRKVESINEICNNTYNEFLNLIPENKIDIIMEAMDLISEGMKNLRKRWATDRCCQ